MGDAPRRNAALDPDAAKRKRSQTSGLATGKKPAPRKQRGAGVAATTAAAKPVDRRRRSVLTALFLLLGLVFGFVSLWLGPLGLIEALIVLGLVLFQVRRFPERGGAYLFGMSLLPVVILGAIVSRVPACGRQAAGAQCYEPVTIVALSAYGAAGVAGAVLLGVALRRMLGAPTASPSA